MHSQRGVNYYKSQIRIINGLSKKEHNEFINSILSGLFCDNKHISSMFFYDEAGSKLFEEITDLPEYYIPRLEKPLIKKAAFYLKDYFRNVDVIEFGCGDCSKISIFLEGARKEYLSSIRYIPVDVSQSAIMAMAEILPRNFPDISICGILSDFVNCLDMLPERVRRIFCLFGSTIGNLNPEQRIQFCTKVSNIMKPDDIFLLGLDMVKEREALFKAYNDEQQVTAHFNKNILKVMNSIIGTSFETDKFEHLAFYNEEELRVEMHLKALSDFEVTSPYTSKKIKFDKGETIHTENSYKFTKKLIKDLSVSAGLRTRNIFSDEKNWFSLVEFVKK